MDELKRKIEAILFSIGNYIALEEISKLCRVDAEKIKEALTALKVDYETDKKSSLVVINESNLWKLTTRAEYSHVVKKIVSETELTKSQLETLAVIAYKYPIKQADLIKIRTNKAYDHIGELENAGYITRQKYGRSKLIKLTDKFFNYFDLPRDKLKERFKGFDMIARTIENKEENIKRTKDEQQRIAQEERRVSDEEQKIANGQIEIDLIDEKGHKQALEIIDKVSPDKKSDGTDKEIEIVDESTEEDKKQEPVTEIKEVRKEEELK